MPTLSKTKKDTKTALKWTGISLIIIFILFILIRFIGSVINSFSPNPPPQAAFGKLSGISFPNQEDSNIVYTLDTISGFLPDFPLEVNVYKIITTQPTLLALDKTQEKVAKNGFNSQRTQISNDVYQWANQESLQSRITINIFSSDFTLSSPYLVSSSLQNLNNIHEQNNAIETAKNFLRNMALFPQDLDESKTTTALFSIENGRLIETSRITSTKIVRVNFFQKDLDNIPIYYEKGIISTMNLLVGKENGKLKVVDGRYFHKDIAKNASTYTIISANDAFEKLKQGDGYIASNPENLSRIIINNVFLGYYIGESNQDFLMPVAVFEGNDGFIAYVSLVKDEWINN